MSTDLVLIDPALPYAVHTGTKNTSFLKVSQILADHGVRNNRFMLAILDPEIAGVDPHASDLSEEMKSRILTEAVRNPWYFIREVVRVKVSGGTVPYALHLGNLFLTWCMISNINTYLVLPRQNYKTVSACAMYAWMYCLATENSHILFFNKELKDSQNNLKRVKDIIELLPTWMRDDVLSNKIGDRNAIEYIWSANRNNRIEPKPAGTSESHADGLGRGNTVPNVWYDEISFMRFVDIIYKAAAPAQSEARVSAIRMGVPYGTVITTTPNSQDDPSGSFAYMVRNGALHFDLSFYDLGPTRVREMMETQAEFNFLYAEYTYQELGRDEKWFREQCRELLNDQMKIKRELLLVWPMSTEGAVFTEEQLEKMTQFKMKIIASLDLVARRGSCPPGLRLEFVDMPDPSKPYVLTIDTSGGVGLDYTAFILSEPYSMRQVASIRTNAADDEAIKALTEHIMIDLFPKSIAVIERNYLGTVLINHLLRINLEPRIFYLEKEKVAEKRIGKMVTRQKSKVRVYGVDTTVESREAMFRHLFQIIDEQPDLIRLEGIQSEIRTLMRKKTGKIEHRSGFHDDRLMSWLIGVYAARHEQPVLGKLISKLGGAGLPNGMAAVAALNVGGDRPPVPTSMAGGSKEMTLDEYEQRANSELHDDKARRKREVAARIAMLNGGLDTGVGGEGSIFG